MNKLKRSIQLLILIVSIQNLNAQFNFTMGYSSVLYKNESLKTAIQTFNSDQNDTLKSGFKTPTYLHGLEMGLRYKWENFALQGGFLMRLNTNKALYRQANDGTLSQKLISNYNSWFIGATGYLNSWFGIGATFDFNTIRIKNKLQTDKNSTKFLNKTNTSSQIFLVFDVPANNVLSISIKPFFQMPWHSTDFTDFNKNLNGMNSSLSSKWWTTGISFLFCNGVQNTSR